MRIRGRANRKWCNRHVWAISALMVACAFCYYLDLICASAGWTSGQEVLAKYHDFHGLVFFAPVVYAAYKFGLRGALGTALVTMFVLLPYAMWVTSYADRLYRPTAFAIILSAVGAAIAMLQKSDGERRKGMDELKCLYDLGRSAESTESIDEFVSSVLELVPLAVTCPEKAEVRVTVRDRTYETPGFKESPGAIRETMAAGGDDLGSIEVVCNSRRNGLKNYSALMETVAERMSGAIRRLELEQSLKIYSGQLEEMVEERTRDLEQAHEKLRLLSDTVKSSIDGITLVDMEGIVTFANEAVESMWGYESQGMPGMKMSQLYTTGDLNLIEGEVIPNSRTDAWNGELTALRKDGSQFPALVTTSPVYDEVGNTVAIVGVHRDITETKNMRDKLIRSERLAAVGELASGVGHELRNPLNVIRNCVYLLNMTLGDQADNDTLSTLKMLDQQVDISNKIVTDLLNFTRIRPPCLERTDLNGLVRESLTWVAKPEDVLVVTTFGGDSPKIRVDAEQVGRAFANIIANAVQSMNGTGEFRVATGAENGHAWARFEDTGCGIPKENLDKIFQPLFTTKPRGIGLGLAITKGLVEQNGGAIEVSSQIEQGTTFTIRLPVCKEGD